jgi:hypothetical protein
LGHGSAGEDDPQRGDAEDHFDARCCEFSCEFNMIFCAVVDLAGTGDFLGTARQDRELHWIGANVGRVRYDSLKILGLSEGATEEK